MANSKMSGDDSFLLKAVQAIAMSPQQAMETAAQYKSHAAKRNPGVSPNDIERIVADKIIQKYSRLVTISGAVSASPGAIPGLGTIAAMSIGGAADASTCLKFQVDMTMLIAATYEWDLTDLDALYMTYLIAASLGVEKLGTTSGAPIASKAGVKMLRQYLRGPILVAVKEIFKKFGLSFSRAALEKALPVGIGVVISSGANFFLLRYVGKQAVKFFQIDRQMKLNS